MPGPLVFSADRRTLISGSADGTVYVLEVLTKKERLRFRADDFWMSCLAVSPDGRTLATTGAAWHRNRIRLWDLATGKKLADFPANGYQLYCLAFSPDGKVLASGGADSTILLWDVARLRR
jgi:WD40 repeat protein